MEGGGRIGEEGIKITLPLVHVKLFNKILSKYVCTTGK